MKALVDIMEFIGQLIKRGAMYFGVLVVMAFVLIVMTVIMPNNARAAVEIIRSLFA